MYSKLSKSSRLSARSILFAGLAVLTAIPLAAQAGSPGIAGWTLEQAKSGEAVLTSMRDRSYSVPDVTTDVADRFRRAASVFTHPRPYPTISVMAYDYITRCALAGSVSVSGSLTEPLRWVRYPGAREVLAIPGMARDSLQSLRGFALEQPTVDAPDCPTTITAAYSSDPAALRGAKKLAEHSASLLSGAQIGSKEAPTSAAAFTRTVQGRIAALGHLDGIDLVGAYRNDEVTIVILGSPGGQTRFASQYRNLPDGRWRFEGASALGFGLANYMENAR